MATANQLMSFNRNQLATIRPHDLRRIQARDAVTASLENTFDGVVPTIRKQRKITTSKAGDSFRARYEGRKDCVFVDSPQQAAKRLKYWDGE
jgi:hypothetical protein